jgi:hypothetical protein
MKMIRENVDADTCRNSSSSGKLFGSVFGRVSFLSLPEVAGHREGFLGLPKVDSAVGRSVSQNSWAAEFLCSL